MSQQDFEIRFDQARARLNNSLKELEKTVIEKLHETAKESRMLHVIADENSLNAKVTEQLSIIQNLGDEINKLQHNLAVLGAENEVMIEENQNLSDKFFKLKEEGLTFAEAIESDLIRIEEIIAGEKNG